jgi:tetratricopeptide (TPR) repeat protein
MDHAPTAVGLVEPVPKALQQAVAHLTNSVNEYSRSSYKMLKVLTILAEGETLQSIKRFYPTEPFHLQNVTELMRLLLLETVSPTASADDLAANRAAKPSIEADIAKVLRIPRQVRDFVRTLISEEDRMEIIHASTELLFGRKWRDGKIRLRRELPRFTGGVGGDPGNEHIVIRSLVYEGLAKRNAATTKRAANLGLAYAEKLLSADRFRDLSVVAGELVHLLEQTEFREQCVDAAALYGKALRMTGKRQEAIRVFEDAIEQGQQYLSKESKASLLLGVALSHEMDGKLSDAADAAREALEFVHPESAHGTQARAIIIGATESGFEREKQLATLEQFARNKEYLVVANNLALDLARTGKNVEESLRLQRLVLRSRGDDYNRMRAIVDRSDLLTRLDRLSELSYKDRQLLSASYSYSYGQRLSGLFDRCHMVLWSVLFKERLWAPLLRVFRHSSFLMRIKGADEQEQRYLHELKEVDSSTFKDAERAALRTELQYLDKRRHDTEDGASPEDSHEGTTE